MKLQEVVDGYGGTARFAIEVSILGRDVYGKSNYGVTAKAVEHWLKGRRRPNRLNAQLIEILSECNILASDIILRDDWR